jgi:hypothetical protein
MAEVYGTPWLEDARDRVVALMTALKTTMASGYDPTFSYVYESHSVADIRLNSVSVGIASQPEDLPLWSGQHTSFYHIEFSLRVHTAYAGDNILIDDQKNARLLNSVIEKLQTNRALEIEELPTANYRMHEITGVTVAETFGLTTGGEVTFIVTIPVEYSQE